MLTELIRLAVFSIITTVVDSVGTVVSDWKVRDPDVVPVLGRGYSMTTGAILSTCLQSSAEVTPSYDSETIFSEILKNRAEAQMVFDRDLSSTFGYWWAKGDVEKDYGNQIDNELYFHHLFTVIKVEKYYSTVDEIESSLSRSAKAVLQRGDYVTFFQSCGPQYIRSIRRSAELFSIFRYESMSSEASVEFNEKIQKRVTGLWNMQEMGDSTGIENSAYAGTLSITNKAYGLGLSGSEMAQNIHVTSMDGYDKLVDYAFANMQDHEVGTVKSIEVMPWSSNPLFQIESAMTIDMESCDAGCQNYSGQQKKFNVIANSEHIARIEDILIHKMNTFYAMQKCQTALYKFPSSFDRRELVNQKAMNIRTNQAGAQGRSVGGSGSSIGMSDLEGMTVSRLRVLLGSQQEKGVGVVINSESILNTRLNSIANYMSLYMVPCVNALAKNDLGVAGGSIFTKAWFSMDECQDMSCAIPNAVVTNGKCVADVPQEICTDPSDESTCVIQDYDQLIEMYCSPKIKDFRESPAGTQFSTGGDVNEASNTFRGRGNN